MAVFATGQSVRPEPGQGGISVRRPVRSFSKVAQHVKIKDEDGRPSVVPSGLFWNLPHSSERRTVPHRPPPSPAVPCRPPPSPPSSAVFHCFPCFPLFSAIPCRHLPSPNLHCHPRHPRPSSTVPYRNMSQMVGLALLPDHCRPGNSRMRTDYVLPSLPVPGSWQSPRRALGGPRMAANTDVWLPLGIPFGLR